MTSTFDDGAAACTTTQRQSYGPLLFQHADSGNWQKLTNAKLRATSTPTMLLTRTARQISELSSLFAALRLVTVLGLKPLRLLARCLPGQILALAKNRDVPDFTGAPWSMTMGNIVSPWPLASIERPFIAISTRAL